MYGAAVFLVSHFGLQCEARRHCGERRGFAKIMFSSLDTGGRSLISRRVRRDQRCKPSQASSESCAAADASDALPGGSQCRRSRAQSCDW